MLEVWGNLLDIRFAPSFTEGATTTRSITELVGTTAENMSIGRDVGSPVTAVDRDSSFLLYSDENPDDTFRVNTTTGQISTKSGVRLDYESKASYIKEMTVFDGSLRDYITVTINIIDIAELPLTPSAPSLSSNAGSLTSLNVQWRAPSNVGRPTITGYDIRYRRSGDTNWIDGPQNTSSTSANLNGLRLETTYEAQVRAINSDGNGPWSPTGSGRTPTPSTPTIWFDESSYGVSEGKTVSVKVNLTPAASSDVTIQLNVANRNGASDADYSGVPTSITIPAGSTSKRFSVTATDDIPRDDRESLQISFGSLPTGVNNGTPITTEIWISEDSTWFLWFTKAAYTSVEGGDGASVTAAISSPWKGNRSLTIPLSDAPKGGAQTSDYTGFPDSIVIDPGATQASFTVTATDDSDVEYGEYVEVRFGRGLPTEIQLGRGLTRSRINLADNDGPTRVKVSFDSETYRAVEGGSGASIEVRLDQAPGREVTLPLSVRLLGSNMSRADYAGVPESLTFSATETSKTFTVTATNESSRDVYKSIAIGFGDLPSAVTQKGPSALVHLDDNREAPKAKIRFSTAHWAITEGASNAHPHVGIDRYPDGDVTIPLIITPLGGATDADHNITARVTIDAAGPLHKGFSLDITEDADIDPGESLKITFGELPKGISLTDRGYPTELIVTIIDNDGHPALAVSDAEASENDDETIDFTVTLSPPARHIVTVDYETENLTASAGLDYTAKSGTLTFKRGETRKTVKVEIIGDTIEDDGEQFRLNIFNASGATVYDNFAHGTIRNTEDTTPAPAIRVSDPEVTEGDNVSLNFKVSLTKASSSDVTVDYDTFDETATAGSDYTEASGTLTFSAGQTSKTISVEIHSDDVTEANETFFLLLNNASGADIDYGDAIGTIWDILNPLPRPTVGGGGVSGFGPAPVAPKFAEGFRTERELPENSRPGDPIGGAVEADHPNDLDITYSLSGTDAAAFTVDEDTGHVRVKEGVSLEVGATYTVNLTATDSDGFGAVIIVTVEVVEASHHLYDANRNGVIDRSEVITAIRDYFSGAIRKAEIIELIRLYFAGSD